MCLKGSGDVNRNKVCVKVRCGGYKQSVCRGQVRVTERLCQGQVK